MVGSSNDPLEYEADRVANLVLALPASSSVSSVTPRIQRYAGQLSAGVALAPASVEGVLARPGRPMEQALQQHMERRFGYDFSNVRVHSDGAAAQSAEEVGAHAYTVGHNIVFGASRLAPDTQEGRQLIAHELTHVVQQSSADRIRLDENDHLPPGSPENGSASASAYPVVVHHVSPIRIARVPSTPSKEGIVLEIEIKTGWNVNDVRRNVTVLDQLATRGRLIRAAKLPPRQSVPDGVAAQQYQKINPAVSTEYKYKILEQGHKQIGPKSSNYDPIRWRNYFELWSRSQGDHVQDLQLGGLDAEENMWLIDASTNEELGSYIAGKLRKVEPGTRIVAVKIKSTPLSPPAPPIAIPRSATQPTKGTGSDPSATPVKPTAPNDSPTVEASNAFGKKTRHGDSCPPRAPVRE